MELYRKYPIPCTIWAFFEVVLFGGVVFGWGSLVFILKEEGFYIDACFDPEHLDNGTAVNDGGTISLLESEVKSKYDVILNVTSTTTKGTLVERHKLYGCQEQESRLNLWFSIAVSFMYLSFAAIGYLIKKIGTRYTRIIFIIGYLMGTMCLAFATPEIPWLLLPGLCLMGTSGLVVLATNLQVANLHPHIRSTIVAIFTGLFDFSSVIKQLVKLAYENGIMRRYSYIAIAIAFVTMVTISTLFLLPYVSISEEQVEDIKRRRSSVKEQETEKVRRKMRMKMNEAGTEEHEKALMSNHQLEDGEETNSPAKPHGPTLVEDPPVMTLCQVLTSLTCILHLYWLFVHALRFVTFIGLLNVWLGDIFHDEMKVSELLGVFSYMTMGSIGTAILCGTIYDWQRRRQQDAGPIRKVYIPVVLPMVLVIIYSIITTITCYIRHPVTPYIAFAVFTFFRSSLFTVGVAFFGEAFPLAYFGVLFGFIQLAAGVAGLIQYPIFKWYDAYPGSYAHVNILMMCLQVSTFVHPVVLYMRGRRDRSPGSRIDREIEVNIPNTGNQKL